jgi:hypothetical protein
MASPLLTLSGKVDASNRLVVVSSAATSATAGTIGAVAAAIATLQGKVDANNALVVRING